MPLGPRAPAPEDRPDAPCRSRSATPNNSDWVLLGPLSAVPQTARNASFRSSAAARFRARPWCPACVGVIFEGARPWLCAACARSSCTTLGLKPRRIPGGGATDELKGVDDRAERCATRLREQIQNAYSNRDRAQTVADLGTL
jgi:hypothetical protein